MTVESDDKPTIFLDTTVLLDVVDRRHDSTIGMLETIRANNLTVLASPFAVLEMIEAKKTDRWTEKMLAAGFSVVQISRRMGSRRAGPSALNRQELDGVYATIRDVLRGDLDMVGFPAPTEGLMSRAEDICAATTLAAGDSLHLATALHFGARILVTSDSDLISIARRFVRATPPQGSDNVVNELS